MKDQDWAQIALRSEIAYSQALVSVPTEHADFVHLHNQAVPWGGDFNCALGVRVTDHRSFDRVVEQVTQIHGEKGLDPPNRYDIYPPPLKEDLWHDHLRDKGYRLQRSIWFWAATLDGSLPDGTDLYTPDEDEYVAWYHERQKGQEWYDEAYWNQLRPLQQGFARQFRPYWLRQDGVRVGWVYCGDVGAYGRLFDVWIEPQFRGQGLGRTLMRAMRLEARKRGLEGLLVRTGESRRGFYERCGLRECLQSSSIRRAG